MKTDLKKKYTHVKDSHGIDHYCQLEIEAGASASQVFDACVEKDVVERYAGNIVIKDA